MERTLAKIDKNTFDSNETLKKLDATLLAVSESINKPKRAVVQIPIVLSSDKANKKDLSLGTFDTNFNDQIDTKRPEGIIPRIHLYNAAIYNWSKNISVTKKNNTIYYSQSAISLEDNSIVLPDGYYSLKQLNTTIDRLVVENGHTSGLIQIQADDATQKVQWTISATNWIVYLKTDKSPYVILGHAAEDTIPSSGSLTTGLYTQLAPNIAAFPSFNSIHVHTSLTSMAVLDGVRSDVIASIQADVAPGSQIIYKPNYPFLIYAEDLGTKINKIKVQLTNENNVPLDLGTFDYQISIMIEI